MNGFMHSNQNCASLIRLFFFFYVLIFLLLRFLFKRLQGKKDMERAQTVKMVQKNVELISTPALRQRMLEKKMSSASAAIKDTEDSMES